MTRHPKQDGAMDSLLADALRAVPAATEACPCAEDLAAYAEGGLSAEEREHVERHAATCARCQHTLDLVASTMPAAPERRSSARAWLAIDRLGWVVAATGAVLVIFYIVVTPVIAPPKTSDQGRQRVEQIKAAERMPGRGEFAANQPPAPLPPAPPSTTAPGVSASEHAVATPPGSVHAGIEKGPKTAGERGANVASADRLRKATVPGIVASPGPAVLPNEPAPLKTATAGGAVPTAPQAAAAPPAQAPSQLGPQGQLQVQTRDAMEVQQREAAAARPVRSIAESVGTSAVIVAPGTAVRWRLEPAGRISRSRDSGATWELLAYRAPGQLLAGSSPAATTCWLAGRGGIVVRTLDDEHWERVPFPESIDLVAITASDARHATVTTRDGRRFFTDDGGVTWTPRQ